MRHASQGEEEATEESLTGDLFAVTYTEKQFTFGDKTLTIKLSQASCTDFDLTGQVTVLDIDRHQSAFVDKQVLELGAGVGICGLLAAQYAAACVITDGMEAVVDLIQANIAKNHRSARAIARRLAWERLQEDLDFYLDRCPRGFDIILASDVVFWEEALPHLFAVVDRLLQRSSQAVFLLAYQSNRSRSQRNDQKLQDTARNVPGLVSRALDVREWMHAASPDLRFLVYSRSQPEG